MGPYCKFCNQRCFVPFPEDTPAEILAAYGASTIIATCAPGQAYERERFGHCYESIQRELALTEKRIVSDYHLPDEHCSDCHDSGHMSAIVIGERMPSVCCTVAIAYNRAYPDPETVKRKNNEGWREVDAQFQRGVGA